MYLTRSSAISSRRPPAHRRDRRGGGGGTRPPRTAGGRGPTSTAHRAPRRPVARARTQLRLGEPRARVALEEVDEDRAHLLAHRPRRRRLQLAQHAERARHVALRRAPPSSLPCTPCGPPLRWRRLHVTSAMLVAAAATPRPAPPWKAVRPPAALFCSTTVRPVLARHLRRSRRRSAKSCAREYPELGGSAAGRPPPLSFLNLFSSSW